MIQDNTLAVRRRQAIGLAGAVLGAAAGAVPATASAQYGMAGKSFNGAWPFDLPPTGHYNSYATGNLNLGIYYDLMEMPLAMLNTSPSTPGALAARRFAWTMLSTYVKSRVCSPSPKIVGCWPWSNELTTWGITAAYVAAGS